jgi:hypothetical protein
LMAMVAAVGVLAGCGFGGLGRGQECAPVGFREGIGLDIAPSSGAGVSSAALKVCWDGQCRDPEVVLMEARDTITSTCSSSEADSDADAACGAEVGPPTGGWHGFADIDGLPGKPVEVGVTLTSASGEVLLDEQITVTPKEPKPDGTTCGSGGRKQTGIIVDGGQLRERG